AYQHPVGVEKALEALGRGGEALLGEIRHAAVMRTQQVEAHRYGVESLEELVERDEVVLRLRHLLAAQRDHVPVRPDPCEGLSRSVRLGDLALMVREDQVEPAAVDVELVTQVL